MRPFPDDLVQAQQERTAIYRQLAHRPGAAGLRCRLYRLSTAVLFHPHWEERGRTPAAWWELRRLGRGGGGRRGPASSCAGAGRAMSALPPDAPRLRAILHHLDQQIADSETVARYLRLQRDAVAEA